MAVAALPPVPPAVQARIEARAGVLAYVPARMLIGFRYRSWEYRQQVLRIRFRNRAGWEVVFVAAPQRGSCASGKQKSFQLDGNKVYWGQTVNEQQAWRCVTGRNGRPVRLVAASAKPPTKLADSGLGIVAASGKRI
jgi:hypothetical protein